MNAANMLTWLSFLRTSLPGKHYLDSSTLGAPFLSWFLIHRLEADVIGHFLPVFDLTGGGLHSSGGSPS
jgi:hypothetical protein